MFNPIGSLPPVAGNMMNSQLEEQFTLAKNGIKLFLENLNDYSRYKSMMLDHLQKINISNVQHLYDITECWHSTIYLSFLENYQGENAIYLEFLILDSDHAEKLQIDLIKCLANGLNLFEKLSIDANIISISPTIFPSAFKYFQDNLKLPYNPNYFRQLLESTSIYYKDTLFLCLPYLTEFPSEFPYNLKDIPSNLLIPLMILENQKIPLQLKREFIKTLSQDKMMSKITLFLVNSYPERAVSLYKNNVIDSLEDEDQKNIFLQTISSEMWYYEFFFKNRLSLDIYPEKDNFFLILEIALNNRHEDKEQRAKIIFSDFLVQCPSNKIKDAIKNSPNSYIEFAFRRHVPFLPISFLNRIQTFDNASSVVRAITLLLENSNKLKKFSHFPIINKEWTESVSPKSEIFIPFLEDALKGQDHWEAAKIMFDQILKRYQNEVSDRMNVLKNLIKLNPDAFCLLNSKGFFDDLAHDLNKEENLYYKYKNLYDSISTHGALPLPLTNVFKISGEEFLKYVDVLLCQARCHENQMSPEEIIYTVLKKVSEKPFSPFTIFTISKIIFSKDLEIAPKVLSLAFPECKIISITDNINAKLLAAALSFSYYQKVSGHLVNTVNDLSKDTLEEFVLFSILNMLKVDPNNPLLQIEDFITFVLKCFSKESILIFFSQLFHHPELAKVINKVALKPTYVDLNSNTREQLEWSKFSQILFSRFERPRYHDSLEKEFSDEIKMVRKSPEVKKSSWLLKQLNDYPNHEWLGRTLICKKTGSTKCLGIKWWKENEQISTLMREEIVLRFLHKHQNILKLKSKLPIPVGVYLFEGKLNEKYYTSTQCKTRAQGSSRDYFIGSQHVALIYEVSDPSYFTYLHDVKDEVQFQQGRNAALSDLATLALHGFVMTEIADFSHNLEEVNQREDSGSYIPLISLILGKKSLGQGRLHGYELGIKTENIRESGLADFAGLYAEGEETNKWNKCNYPRKDILFNVWYQNKSRNQLKVNFKELPMRMFTSIIGEHLLCDFLTLGHRKRKIGSLNWQNETEITNYAQEIISGYETLFKGGTNRTDQDITRFLNQSGFRWKKLAYQGAFWMNYNEGGYVSHVQNNHIPKEIYGKNCTVDINVKYISNWVNNYGFSHDKEAHDLGAFNGSFPIKEWERISLLALTYLTALREAKFQAEQLRAKASSMIDDHGASEKLLQRANLLDPTD